MSKETTLLDYAMFIARERELCVQGLPSDEAGAVERFIAAADRAQRQGDDQDLAQLHENGAKAWTDVPDATAWVDELRCSDAIDTPPGRDENQAGNAQMPVVSVEYQHEDTGIVGHVDEQQVEWGFFKNNPRLQFVCNLVRQSDAQAVLAAKDAEIAALKAERDALKVAAKYAEHIDATPENQLQTMLHDTMTDRDELEVSEELYRWLTEYQVSDDCSVDDAIVACKSPAEISAVIAAAIAKEKVK